MSEYSDERKAKLASGNFSWKDLKSYAQAFVDPNAKIHILEKDTWTLIGDWQILLKEVGGNLDDAFARVVVRPHNKLWNWLVLAIAKYYAKGEWILWENFIPGTNIIIDVWYIGDGSEGHVLAAEGNIPQEKQKP